MKTNNKGFLLAETIVTVCIIATLATSMYLYVSKTTSRFEDRNNYENVVDVYKVHTIKSYLDKKGRLLEGNIGEVTPQLEPKVIDQLKIKKVFLIQNTIDSKNSIDVTTSRALKDYVNWLQISGNGTDLRLVVWFNSDESDGTFATLRIIK